MILLLPAYLIAAYIYTQNKYEQEVCADIKIELLNPIEEQFLTETDIIEIIDNNDLASVGENLDKIDLKRIEETIQENPIVKNNECYKTPSGNIIVELEQRTPIYRVITPTETY
ncbi:MAG: hypothetical protein IJ269_05770, partial [Bacteroidales bacterium]|nr:hypothetical protein [Bacteroidales bacterium]